jgi:sugar lactone lactonase YvrE
MRDCNWTASGPCPMLARMTKTPIYAVMAAALSFAGCSDDGAADDPKPVLETRVVAEFDGASFELPESLAYHDGKAYLSFLNGSVVTVDAAGARTEFGSIAIDPPGSAYALGIAVAGGTAYVAMAKASADSTFPAGIYRIPASGGAGTLFASHPALYLPNDVDVDAQGNLYITADGAVFKKTGASPGEAELWKEDPLLASSDGATGPCGARTSPFPIGANGIEVESSRVVVGNTESGSLVTIAIGADGAAGAATTLVMSASQLCGIDGLVGDTDGSYLATALGTSLVRISADGSAISVVHAGAPFRTPAGVDVGAFGGGHQAIVANPDFEHAFGAGGPASASPNLTAVPL